MKWNYFFPFFCICTALAFGKNIAVAEESKYCNFQEAVEIALHDNADLLAIRSQEESFKLRSKQALAPNNPVLSHTKSSIPGLSLTQRPAQDTYAINFTLGFPGKALSQSASIRRQAEASREQAISKEIDIMTALSNNFISFFINQKFYEFLLEEQKRDLELTKLLEKKFAASQAAKVDLLNAEVITQNIAKNILENRNEYEVLLTQFRQIIRRPEEKNLLPKIPTDIAIPSVDISLDELTKIMLRKRHSLQATQRQVESAEAALAGASLAAFPDFQLTGGINIWNQPSAAPNPGVNRDYVLGIGIAIPIFFPLNELPGIKAAKSDLSSSEYQFESQRLQALSDLQASYTGLAAAKKELDVLTKLVVPAAKASYDLTLLTYGLGKSDYFRLNEARKTMLEAEKELLSKRQSSAQLYNQLIAQVGCDISKLEGPHACK